MLLQLSLLFVALPFCVADYPYAGPGSYEYTKSDPIKASFPETGCKSDTTCSVTFTSIVPKGDGPFPVAVFSNGFSIKDDQYVSYAERLASWGYVAFVWNPSENPLSYIVRRARGSMPIALANWAANNSTFKDVVDSSSIFSVGHSVGGQSATLAAVYDKRVKGVLGVDPVDCPPPFAQYSDDNPQAGPLIKTATWAKFAWIGSELGPQPFLGIPCAPSNCNYPWMFSNTTETPSWEVMIKAAGHMQFLDDRKNAGLDAALCIEGADTQDQVTGDLTKTIMIAWAEFTVRGKDISREYLDAWAKEQVAAGLITSTLK